MKPMDELPGPLSCVASVELARDSGASGEQVATGKKKEYIEWTGSTPGHRTTVLASSSFRQLLRL